MSAEALALFIAGIVSPFLAQLVKEVLGLEGKVAAWAAFIVSMVIAILAMVLSGGFSGISLDDPATAAGALVTKIGVVFTIATLVYKSLEGKWGLKSSKDLEPAT